MAQKFRKKPVAIEAVQWDGQDVVSISCLAGSVVSVVVDGVELTIKTLEGNMRANVGDWIIKGVRGELYPCREDIFNETYERVED